MLFIEEDGRSSGAIASGSAQMSQRVDDRLRLARMDPQTPDRAA
ncbi:hypothetical protein [Laspinema palackyanum]